MLLCDAILLCDALAIGEIPRHRDPAVFCDRALAAIEFLRELETQLAAYRQSAIDLDRETECEHGTRKRACPDCA